jgi:hypothetical protein
MGHEAIVHADVAAWRIRDAANGDLLVDVPALADNAVIVVE